MNSLTRLGSGSLLKVSSAKGFKMDREGYPKYLDLPFESNAGAA